MKKLNLSIIIPVYNTEKYLRECIDSILSQGMNSYEIIIINDGSTDGSEEIINEYVEKYQFIKYIFQENEGQGSARNKGINLALGKYIYFMDSDDILNTNLFSKVFSKTMNNDVDAMFFDGKSFIDNNYKNDKNIINKFSYTRNKSYGLFESGEQIFVEFSRDKVTFISPCLYIVKASVYKDNNLYFPESIKHEDEVFTMKLFFYLSKVEHISEEVFLRRIRENSTMTKKNYLDTFRFHVAVLERLDEFYHKFKFNNSTAKEYFFKKNRNLFVIGLKLFDKVNGKKTDEDYINLVLIGKKNHYFDKYGKLAKLNIKFYKLFSFWALNIKKFSNTLSHR